jgi:hypothetical protein
MEVFNEGLHLKDAVAFALLIGVFIHIVVMFN